MTFVFRLVIVRVFMKQVFLLSWKLKSSRERIVAKSCSVRAPTILSRFDWIVVAQSQTEKSYSVRPQLTNLNSARWLEKNGLSCSLIGKSGLNIKWLEYTKKMAWEPLKVAWPNTRLFCRTYVPKYNDVPHCLRCKVCSRFRRDFLNLPLNLPAFRVKIGIF